MRKLLLPLILIFLAIPQISFAQANLSGAQILEQFKSNPSQAIQQLTKQSGASSFDANNLLSSLKNNPNITNLSGGKLLDGIISKNIKIGDIGKITDMVKGLKNIIADPKFIKDLIGKVAIGKLPPEIGKVLGKLKALGKLKDIKSLKDLFKNPEIVKGLKDILSKTGLSSEVTKAIADITKIVGDIEKLKELGPELIAKAIASILPPELVELLGGLDVLIGLITPSIGGIIGGVTPTDPSGGGTGKYEIFDRDPKGSPVDKNCDVGCSTCTCRTPIENNHKEIRKHTSDEFIKHRNWFIDELFTKQILPAMTMMSSQLSTIAVQQTQIIGSFFDAKHQLETQRLFQQLMAEAHKDYQPSEGLCEIGTNVRSLAASEKKSKLSHTTFANYIMGRQLRNADTAAGSGDDADIMSRIHNFKGKYCNKNDNTDGLGYLCKDGGTDKARMNKDVDFTRTLESKLTLDIDFSTEFVDEPQPDREDIFALSANLFAHEPLPAIPGNLLANGEGKPKSMAKRYMDLRSIAAKRSVAQNSFSAIVAERTSGDKEVAPFLKKLISELDIPDDDVEAILGKSPSYFAQMEVLTKDIYQNPVFYTELYDKPANVLRKSATIRAINLMQERDLYESQLRSEAVLAIMLETMLREEHNRVHANFVKLTVGGD